MRNLFYFSIALVFVALGVFVIAQVPLTNPPPIIVNANSCTETDGGANYLLAGNVTGSFWWAGVNGTNSTWSGTFTDSCSNNVTLLEGVCGSSINATLYGNLAGALYVNCAAVPVNSTLLGQCSLGRCI